MTYATLLFCTGMAWLLAGPTAWAEDPSHEEMICALTPDCAPPFADRRLRGVSSKVVRPPLSFDITLNFPFDSAELTEDSREKLARVAKALTAPTTSRFDIIISGHTDARGTTEYNKALSDRRADAVRRYLVSQHGIEVSRLVSKGYGKSQLLLPGEPYNDLNRRVQFQNASAASATPAKSTVSSPAPSPVSTTAARPRPMTPAADGDGL
jgi:outer membrane protein OmpA-like peptidoglycan-associated protein